MDIFPEIFLISILAYSVLENQIKTSYKKQRKNILEGIFAFRKGKTKVEIPDKDLPE